MKRQTPFLLSAKNSLKVHEIYEPQKALNNTFKGNNDLRTQLYKTKQQNNNKSIKVTSKTETFRGEDKSEQEVLMQEVAALDNFKAPVTREKTKNMIENIKLRRREKHIDCYNKFQEDLNDYKQNLIQIYQSLSSDTMQVLTIKEMQITQYLNSQKEEYVVTREKELLTEIQDQVMFYGKETKEKMRVSFEELNRIKSSRDNIVNITCQNLREQLIDIAFILEDEIKEIQAKQKKDILEFEESYFSKYLNILKDCQDKLKMNEESLNKQMAAISLLWKSSKQALQLQLYISDTATGEYRHSSTIISLYKKLEDLQILNSNRKMKLLENLIKENVESYSKSNIQKWGEFLKIINDTFDKEFDQILALLMKQFEVLKEKNTSRFHHLKGRLSYIENKTQEENQLLLKSQCSLILERNLTSIKDLIKRSTQFVQNRDSVENQSFQKCSIFLLKMAEKNDTFAKDFQGVNQKFQLQKAKILDDDDQILEKLNKQFSDLKQELIQSLHHIKLEEIQKKCFEKIDQIQKQYRGTHQKNKKLLQARPQILSKFMKDYQAKIAETFNLYDQSRRNELVEKNKKQAEELVLKKIQEEEKVKLDEENRLIEDAKKKGGKPPAPSKKDPKKAAAELEQRKKILLTEIGVKQIEQLKSETGSLWLVYRNITEICTEFYKKSEKSKEEAIEGADLPNEENNLKKMLALDELDDPPKDFNGEDVLSKTSFIRISNFVTQLELLRAKIFQNLAEKSERINQESNKDCESYLEESLSILDERLKQHYSLKGKLQSEIYIQRSSEITNHKKEYQKYIRNVKEKIDLQTQRFNYLLQKNLEQIKEYNSTQKSLKQQLQTGKNLSEIQNIQSKSKEKHKIFTNQLKELTQDLQRLSNDEIDAILVKNNEFMSKNKLKKEGGQFSQEEIQWYKTMIDEINKQIEEQKIKRKEKMKEVLEHIDKKKKQLADAFQKDYNNLLEQISARDGTGKKYGRPKRIAQQKVRLEMNKCEQAQMNIDKQIENLYGVCEHQAGNKFSWQSLPQTLRWRQQLMTVQTCITRYARHIEALLPNLKIKPMIRVNYDQNNPDANLSADGEEEDKKRLQVELSKLGPLSEQKDDKTFIKYIDDIQKIISDEARTIYNADKDKVKYITGTDKIPDFLRIFNANMKKNAEDFRQVSVRQLRQSCDKLSNLCQNVSELFFRSLFSYYSYELAQNRKNNLNTLTNIENAQSSLKEVNLRALRPNLSNPKCQDELNTLNKNEQKRWVEYAASLQNVQKQFEERHFKNGVAFLNSSLNNFQFLILYHDSLFLYEDFIKVAGDQNQEKTYLDIKRKFIVKEKGLTIDSNSQRNIRKKWDGLKTTIFNFDQYKYILPIKVQEVKEKDKKAGKKDSKDPKKVQEAPVSADSSKMIETFKTQRQKSAFVFRDKCTQEFRKEYESTLAKITEKLTILRKQSESFKLKWINIAKDLFIK